MANSYTNQVLEEGPENFIVKLTGVLDTSNEAINTRVSPSDCQAFIPTQFSVEHIDFAISDPLEVQLWWEGTPDAIIVPLVGRAKFSYHDLGGIQNSADAPTGGIRVLTTGYTTGTQVYSVVMWLKKQGVERHP